MDKDLIETLLNQKPQLAEDSYRDSIVEILTPPSWYRPLARYRFYKQLDQRVALVMAEYAKDLVNALTGGEDQTPHTKQTPETEARTSEALTEYPEGLRTDL